MGFLSFGYLNKLPDVGGKKGAWILISCCCGKVNERGAARKAGRVLHHGAFMTVPPCSLQGQVASYCLGQDRRAQGRRDVFAMAARE